MKLIDKDAVVAEIERRISQLESEYKKLSNLEIWITAKEIKYKINGLKEALSIIIINSLKVKEVNLKKEIEEWLHNGDITDTRFDDYRDSDIESTAKHFFELGMQVSSNISVEVTSIDEELKENGIDPNSKEAKILKESYYTAIEKLSTMKGE